MNPLFNRWLQASLAKHFRNVCVANSISFVSEREIKNVQSLQHWVELRTLGPEYYRTGLNQYILSLEIDLLVSSMPDATNIYRVDDITGLLTENCDRVPISKSNDPDDFLFCITLDKDIPQNIRVVSYGQANDTKLRRASIMAIYETQVEF